MRLRFSLPLVALLPVILGILMTSMFFTMADWLGFTHCSAWFPLSDPPEKVDRFIDVFGENVYLQTNEEGIYCFQQSQWKKCMLPPYRAKLHTAPNWLVSNFISLPSQDGITQLIRANKFLDSTYYALSESGKVWACSTDFETQFAGMYHSGAIMLLVVPFGLACWSAGSFLNIFARYANPVYWDFLGRGTRIK
jgi:hypothetical protein